MLKVILWGTGNIAKRYMDTDYARMRSHVQIVAFIDNNVEKQGKRFYDYPILSYEQADGYEFDYIVIMNLSAKEIYRQIGKEIESDNIVISSDEFYGKFADTGYWKDKSILFYGDRMNYELAEYRSEFTFKNFQYMEENKSVAAEKFDFVFLCPPGLISPQEKTAYEENLRKKIKCKYGIEDEKIVKFDEWIRYFQCDREIGRGEKNKDKRFYIIALSDPMQGWGNILTRVWGGIAYAHNHQMIPVVDMKNLKSQYLPENLLGKHNAWEDFFELLNEYDLDEVYESKNVVLSGVNVHIAGAMEVTGTVYKQNVSCRIEEAYRRLFPVTGKILGVVYRGTDYNRAYSHHASGDIGSYIGYIKEYMAQIEYEYIFLATEVEEATAEFKKEFGDRVFWAEQERYKAAERRWLYSIHFDREKDELKKGMEYLTVLDLLSKCDSIVGTNTGTVRAAVVLNQERYEHINILSRNTENTYSQKGGGS